MAKQHKPFLPTTHKGWILAILAIVLALQPILLLVGMHTGRIGYTFVEGNSMTSVFPWGCLVVILPLRPVESDCVVAWTWGGMDGASEKDDKKPGFVIKHYVNSRLESTDSSEKYSHDFRITGVVEAWLPSQRVFWWMNKGAQRSQLPSRTKGGNDAISAGWSQKVTARTQDDVWLSQHCRALVFKPSTSSWSKTLQPTVVYGVRIRSGTPNPALLSFDGVQMGASMPATTHGMLWVSREGRKVTNIEIELDQGPPGPNHIDYNLDEVTFWVGK